jgi:hypothetical protein
MSPATQMFKILGLLCLSTAYGLSVMYLQGVKMSDMQVGWLVVRCLVWEGGATWPALSCCDATELQLDWQW